MKWLKDRLKKWLMSPDQEERVDHLDCVVEGRCRRMTVVGIAGMRLMVSDREGQYVVGSGQCIEPRLFWVAWNQRTPGHKYTWPDGTPFKPGE